MENKLKGACSQGKPAFFVVFSEHLRIPPAFVNFFGRSLGKCTLIGPNGNRWDVEVEKREHDWFFCSGWPEFASDHSLVFGEFLIFEYDGGSGFEVTLYDNTWCEKEVQVVAKSNSDKLSGTATGPKLFQTKNPHFVRTMKPYLLSQVVIPKKIAIAEGLLRKDGSVSKVTEVMIQDPTGRSWLAGFVFKEDGRLLLARGWTSCKKENQISVGDTVVFEFVKQGVNRVIQVHITRGTKSSVVLAK